MARMTEEQVSGLVDKLSKEIRGRQVDVQEKIGHYKGETGRLKFATEEFREYTGSRYVGFSDNWCAPVADAPIERMNFQGVRLPDQLSASSGLARIWDSNDAHTQLKSALAVMCVARRAFGLVTTVDGKARVTFEHPDSAAVLYDGVTRARKAGLVYWQDDSHDYAELLLPHDRVYFKRERPKGGYTKGNLPAWRLTELNGSNYQPNPLGAVPLVEMANKDLLDGDPMSDIGLVIPMQGAVNLVWAYMLNGLDYASLPARLVLNGTMPEEEILDEDGNVVGTRPMELDSLLRERIAWLQGENVSVAEWTAGNLESFSKVIEQAVQHIAAQTRTPAHYLLSSSEVPATGYEAAEAGLTSKVLDRIAYANPAIKEISRLAALAEGNSLLAAQIPYANLMWAKPLLRSEAKLMDGLIKLRQAGFPFEFIAEEYGLSPLEVKRVVALRQAEAREDVKQLMDLSDEDGQRSEDATDGSYSV